MMARRAIIARGAELSHRADVADEPQPSQPTRSQPATRRIALPTIRDQRELSAKFAEFTPAKLGTIIRETERGLVENWADLCDRMVVDAAVKADYESRLAAVSASRRVVEPGRTGDPTRDRYAEDARSFVEQVLDDVPGFDDVVQDLLDGIGKGLGVAEIDWQYVAGTWIPANIWWVHTRRFRYSRTWEPMLVDTGDELHADGIPLEPGKFIVHQPKTVAGYPMLTGVMRSVAWPHLFKRWCQQFWLNGAERFAWPFIWAKVPRNAPPEVRAKALQAAEKLSADHAAVLEDGGAFELLESTVKDGGTWRDFHGAMNAEIAKAIRGMTDATEPGKVGAYGAVESRKGMTVDARIALDERQLASAVRRDLVTHLVWFNRHRWNGVFAPVPHVRWMIANKRQEIPAQVLPVARNNEVRATVDLPPLQGPEGDALFGSSSGGTTTAMMDVVKAVAAGEIPRDAGIALLIEQGVDEERAERVMGSAGVSAEPKPSAAKPEETLAEDDEIAPGSEWIDTEDDHRLRVTRATPRDVYFVDLDGPNPKRQWAWRRATFLERAAPAPAADAA